ncbi:MAG: hypothetical protein ACXWKP_17460 [Bradyrhizobium sp.]|jgi:hypothetical protein
MESQPKREFGKRRPVTVPLASAQPVKRSGHVALLVMGTLAIGGSAFALMPRENCEPKGAGMAGPALPQTSTACPPRGSSSGVSHGGSGGSWSRSGFYGGDAASNRSSSGTSADSGSGGVTRGGFGGFARAFAAHFSGG